MAGTTGARWKENMEITNDSLDTNRYKDKGLKLFPFNTSEHPSINGAVGFDGQQAADGGALYKLENNAASSHLLTESVKFSCIGSR